MDQTPDDPVLEMVEQLMKLPKTVSEDGIQSLRTGFNLEHPDEACKMARAAFVGVVVDNPVVAQRQVRGEREWVRRP